jgi:hypothetical protein
VVELAARPPAGVVAIVLVDATGKPRSFGLVEAGAPLVAYDRSRCGVLPDGTTESAHGDQVTVFFVDKYGFKSKHSNVVKVVAKVQHQGE